MKRKPSRKQSVESAVSEEVLEAIEALPRPDARTEQALQDLFEKTKVPEASASAWPPILEEPRLRADSRYADPASSHRPLVGPALVAAKRSFRAVFQPFINEVLRRQVEFNESLLNSLAVIYEQVRVQAQTQVLWRRELEERLEQLETKVASARVAEVVPPVTKPRSRKR